MNSPTISDVEREARELLAEELAKEPEEVYLEENPDYEICSYEAAIRAIAKALSQTTFSDGVEAAARVVDGFAQNANRSETIAFFGPDEAGKAAGFATAIATAIRSLGAVDGERK